MNFLDIFVSDGGWKYIPWKCFGHHIMVRKLVWQKRPIIFDPSEIYPFFYWTFELHSIFSHLWSTSVDLNFYVIKKPQSSPTQRYCNFGIFVSYVVLQIFAFSCTDTARPDFEITTFIWAYWGRFWQWHFFENSFDWVLTGCRWDFF